jgi:hypothetical protein
LSVILGDFLLFICLAAFSIGCCLAVANLIAG